MKSKCRPKWLFLDIDGVLLPFGHGVEDSSTHTFPARCLDALARIMSASAPRVVLSSTWRCDPHAMALIRQQFDAYGDPLRSIALDTFTDLSYHAERQWEIAAWLRDAAARGDDVGSFCVLDDMDCVDGKPNRKHRAMFESRCVLVESATGLSAQDAELAIRILGVRS